MLEHALAGEAGAPPVRAARVLRRQGRRLWRAPTCVGELEAAARLLGVADAGGRARRPGRAPAPSGSATARPARDRRRGALGFARAAGVPVVLIVGEVHVVHDPVINSGIHDLVAGQRRRAAAARLLSRSTRRRRRCAACIGPAPARPCAPRCRPPPPATCFRCCSAPTAAGRTRWSSTSSTTCSRRLPAHRARKRRPRRQRRLRHPRAGVPARRAGVSRGAARPPPALRVGRRRDRDRLRAGRDAVAAARPVDPRRLERCERPVALSLRNNRERTFLFGNIGGSGGRFAAAAMRGAGIDARFVGATSPARPRPGAAGLLGQGVPALPAHLGHAGRLPRRRRRHHRRGRPACS